jgi:hypothetical protein
VLTSIIRKMFTQVLEIFVEHGVAKSFEPIKIS